MLIDAGAADPGRLAAAIGLIAHGAAQPAAILIGAHLPASLARAILKLDRSDVLDAPAHGGRPRPLRRRR